MPRFTINLLNTIVRLSKMSLIWIEGLSHLFWPIPDLKNRNPDLLRTLIYCGFLPAPNTRGKSGFYCTIVKMYRKTQIYHVQFEERQIICPIRVLTHLFKSNHVIDRHARKNPNCGSCFKILGKGKRYSISRFHCII